ncbi:MAG: very short patch repair endonuclease [Planctomycetota bacterium]
MTDVFTIARRSMVMSRIRSSGNERTELRLIQLFREAAVTGWRRSQSLAGKPDFVFRRERIVVFVDGCFWHGCPRCYRRPKSNLAYWDAKVEKNRKRDRTVSRLLKCEGWQVMRIWEHQLRNGAQHQIAKLKRLLAEMEHIATRSG